MPQHPQRTSYAHAAEPIRSKGLVNRAFAHGVIWHEQAWLGSQCRKLWRCALPLHVPRFVPSHDPQQGGHGASPASRPSETPLHRIGMNPLLSHLLHKPAILGIVIFGFFSTLLFHSACLLLELHAYTPPPRRLWRADSSRTHCAASRWAKLV
ncbi:uncharacterized protein J3D65DRAFT_483278 [Phyllosticta citribraziliensis]|uniref:Uncharacterized protein n=1 Tax=Phyllosticta citribraziliensis TaxID=989973 RepID=A0ABR1LGK1_9PEZI